MDNRQIISSLNELANELDQCGQYKFSEEIDNLIRIAILHGHGPKFRYDHPMVGDLKRGELEPLPPQNLIEKVFQEFAGYGKPLPRSFLGGFINPIPWNVDEFLDDVLKDYKKDNTISMDFIKLITSSSEFVKKLDLNLKNNYRERVYTFKEKPEVFKKILQEAENELIESLEKEFKKLKGLFVYNPNTRINKVVPALLEIKELLPPKFLAYVEAVNEWLNYQNNAEKEMFEKQDMFHDNWRSAPQARDELENYLKPKEEEEKLSVFSKYTINKLYKIANSLDEANLYKQASSVTNLMKRIAK